MATPGRGKLYGPCDCLVPLPHAPSSSCLIPNSLLTPAGASAPPGRSCLAFIACESLLISPLLGPSVKPEQFFSQPMSVSLWLSHEAWPLGRRGWSWQWDAGAWRCWPPVAVTSQAVSLHQIYSEQFSEAVALLWRITAWSLKPTDGIGSLPLPRGASCQRLCVLTWQWVK